jgi:hypothetical protein
MNETYQSAPFVIGRTAWSGGGAVRVRPGGASTACLWAGSVYILSVWLQRSAALSAAALDAAQPDQQTPIDVLLSVVMSRRPQCQQAAATSALSYSCRTVG